MARRPRLPKTDAEMQRWCARLEDEVSGWPAVTSRPMFGLLAFYRARRIFAAVPRSRAVNTPYSLLLKLPAADDDRLVASSRPGTSWVAFEMMSEDDVAPALEYLALAYEHSTSKRPAVRSTRGGTKSGSTTTERGGRGRSRTRA